MKRARLGFKGRREGMLFFLHRRNCAAPVSLTMSSTSTNGLVIRTAHGTFCELPNLNVSQLLSGNPILAPQLFKEDSQAHLVTQGFEQETL